VQVGGNAYLAWLDDVLGGVTVTGAGSQWTVAEMMEVGLMERDRPRLDRGRHDRGRILDRRPQSAIPTLAEYFAPGADLGGGTGQVTVTGAGSTLEAGGPECRGFLGKGLGCQ